MDNNQALAALIGHISASGKPIQSGWDEVGQWQDGVLERFIADGLMVKDVNASSLQCTGCDHHCFMDILLGSDDSNRAFIVCDHPDMQSQMGRISVPLERLQQWQSSPKQLAVVIAGLLGLADKPTYQKDSASFKLGMLKGRNGRRWVTLNTQLLTLEVNRHTTPVIDVLYFEQGVLALDQRQVDERVNAAPKENGKAYIPNVSKQEVRKLTTQAMYQDWNDEYLQLKQKRPDRSDTWCSMQIAKMAIAQDKDSETIRKNMKK